MTFHKSKKSALIGIASVITALLMVAGGYWLAYARPDLFPLGILISGSGLWGCWTIAHDCLHGALFKGKRSSEIVGSFVAIPTLFPFFSMKFLHLAHHRHLNNVHKDRAWRPWTIEQYKAQHAVVRLFYRVMRGWFWWMGPMFFLVFEHFRSTNCFSKDRKKHGASVLSIMLYICSIVIFIGSISNSLYLIAIILLSHAVFSGIFATLTLMQHTHGASGLEGEIAPWHEKDAPARRDPLGHTIDYTYPRLIEWFFWNGNIHSPHHLNPKVPFYKLRAARESLKNQEDDATNKIIRRKFSWGELSHIIKEKHLYNPSGSRFVSFGSIGKSLLVIVVSLSATTFEEAAHASTLLCKHYASSVRLDFNQVTKIEKLGEFSVVNCSTATFGFDTRQHWLKIEFLDSKAKKSDLIEVGYPALDHVKFYQQNKFGDVESKVSGDMLPFAERSIAHRTFVFEKVSSENPVFLEINTEGSVQIPVRALTGIELAENSTTEFAGMGIYYGIMISMLLYNFFLFVVVRERTYLYYVLYVGAFTTFQASLNGLGIMYLWPSAVMWNNFSIPILISTMFGFMFLFTINFIQSKKTTPKSHQILVVGSVLSFLFAVGSLFIPLSISIKSVVLYSILCSVVVMASGILSAVNRYRPARYFLLAWTVFLAGIVVISFKNFGILPSGFITDYGMQIGSALETVLLSMGLGYRIRQVEDEKSKALVSAHQVEQEAVKHKAIARTTQMLAHDVRRPFVQMQRIVSSLLKENDAEAIKEIARSSLPTVERSIGSVTGMLQDILEIERMVSFTVQAHNLQEIFESSLGTTLGDDHSRKQDIKNNIPKDLRVDVDRDRIERVFCNLLSNALEASERGDQIWAEVTSDLKAETGFVKITIGNRGRLIPDVLKDRLFDMFATSGKSKGTGLGLAIAKKIVEAHGGKIWAESSKDLGTQFHILLKSSGSAPEAFAAENGLPRMPQIKRVVVLEDCPWTIECWNKLDVDTSIKIFENPEEFFSQFDDDHNLIANDTVFIFDFFFDNSHEINGGHVAEFLRSKGYSGNIYLSSVSLLAEEDRLMQYFSGRIPKDPELAVRKLGLK